jgi:ribosomal protein L7Ae-like RNA K-turn-binding protein
LKTKEKFQKIAKENNIPIFVFGTIDDNSRAIGKKNKAIIAIKDKNFSEAICKIINGGEAIGQN